MSIFPRHGHEPFHAYELHDPFLHPLRFPGPRFPLPPPFPIEPTPVANAKFDWYETHDAHIIKADLPGFRKDEVKVEVEDGNVLCLHGEKKVGKEEKGDNWHYMERSSGAFMRRFTLPASAKAHKKRTYYENGVLTVTIPKVETKKHSVFNHGR